MKEEGPHYSPALAHNLVSATGIGDSKLAPHLDTGWRGNPVFLAVPDRDELVGGREQVFKHNKLSLFLPNVSRIS